MRAAFGAQFIDRALEMFDRLGALERVAALENERRHTATPQRAAPTTPRAAHFRAIAADDGPDK